MYINPYQNAVIGAPRGLKANFHTHAETGKVTCGHNGIDDVLEAYVEKKIANFILEQSDTIIHMTVAQLSKNIGVADSSIIRLCQKLGLYGFTQLKINISKSLQKYEEPIPSDIEPGDPPHTIMRKVFTSSNQALKDTLEVLDIDELSKAVEAIATAKS